MPETRRFHVVIRTRNANPKDEPCGASLFEAPRLRGACQTGVT